MPNAFKTTFGRSATVLQGMALQRDRVLILVLKMYHINIKFGPSRNESTNQNLETGSQVRNKNSENIFGDGCAHR